MVLARTLAKVALFLGLAAAVSVTAHPSTADKVRAIVADVDTMVEAVVDRAHEMGSIWVETDGAASLHGSGRVETETSQRGTGDTAANVEPSPAREERQTETGLGLDLRLDLGLEADASVEGDG